MYVYHEYRLEKNRDGNFMFVKYYTYDTIKSAFREKLIKFWNK